MKKMQSVTHPVLLETAEGIRRIGKAAYQENLLEKLEQDILRMSG